MILSLFYSFFTVIFFLLSFRDNLPHTLSNDPDWDVIYETLHNITVLFNENFPGIPLFPCIGNHDTFPPNMLLPNKTADSIYLKILTKGGWNKYLNDESVSTFIKGYKFLLLFFKYCKHFLKISRKVLFLIYLFILCCVYLFGVLCPFVFTFVILKNSVRKRFIRINFLECY